MTGPITEAELTQLRGLDARYGDGRGVVFATGAELDSWIERCAGDSRAEVQELGRILKRFRLALQSEPATKARIIRDALEEWRRWSVAVYDLAGAVAGVRHMTRLVREAATAAGNTAAALRAERAPTMRLASPGRFENSALVSKARGIDVANRRVQVVVSTNDVARDGAIIEPRGWVFTNYDRNSVVLWAHDDRALPIAKAIPSLRVITDTALIETHQFADHPAAEEVWKLVRDGFLCATSVRWIPGETQMRRVNGRDVLVFTKGHELVEVSYLPIPADPGALVIRQDGHVFNPRAARLVAA